MSDKREKSQVSSSVVNSSLAGGVVGATIISVPAFAADTDFAASISTLSGISAAAQPIAIGALIFGVGALIVKKFLYA